MSNKNKIKALFGIFPVWLDFKKNSEAPEISGFWSDIAIFVDQNAAFFCHLISFGLWDKEEFAFFPYEANGCKYWIQALIKSITAPR